MYRQRTRFVRSSVDIMRKHFNFTFNSRIIPSIRPLNFAMTNISRQLAICSPSDDHRKGRSVRVFLLFHQNLSRLIPQLRKCRYCGKPLLYEMQTIAKLYSSCASYASSIFFYLLLSSCISRCAVCTRFTGVFTFVYYRHEKPTQVDLVVNPRRSRHVSWN